MAKKRNNKAPKALLDDLIIAGFAFASVALLSFEILATLTEQQLSYIHTIDTLIAFFFLGEFVLRLIRADKKWNFLLLHWWEILAGIPIHLPFFQVFRSLRILRVVTVFEALRIIRASARLEVVGELAGAQTRHKYVVEAVSSLLAILFGSSVLFLSFEQATNGSAQTLWDAFYWSIATITTTGYGDIHPHTTGGRIVAIVLMLTGAATMTLITATLVRYLTNRKPKR
jgi:voltage-gated potassium channel